MRKLRWNSLIIAMISSPAFTSHAVHKNPSPLFFALLCINMLTVMSQSNYRMYTNAMEQWLQEVNYEGRTKDKKQKQHIFLKRQQDCRILKLVIGIQNLDSAQRQTSNNLRCPMFLMIPLSRITTLSQVNLPRNWIASSNGSFWSYCRQW